MSFPDAFTRDMVLGPDQVLPTVPRGFGERFDLEWKAARAPDKWYFFETRMRDLWDDALEKLHKATGQRFRNPYPADPLRRDDPFTDVLAAFDQARAGQFDLPDPRRFEDKIRDEATKLRQDAQRSALASYGAGGLGAFLGAAAGELSHPVNLATLPIGGAYATGNIARLGLLRFLGRNALIEGGVAMASQTAIEIADAPYQERLATDTGLEDRLERIFIAGAGGAILGMGLSGLVAAARGVRRRLNPTLDEADAIKVAERATLHEGKNPLGPEGGIAHSRALETAEAQVAAGRHADVREIVEQEVKRQVQSSGRIVRPDEPPLQPGFVRLYHGGGTAPGGEARWVTERREYAEGYASKSAGGKVYYVDVPESSPHLKPSFDTTGTNMKAPYVDFEAPPEIAGNLKPLLREAAAPPDPKYRDTLSAIRDAEDLGEEVTAKWLASATGTTAKQAEKIIARLQKDGILGEADAAGAHTVDIGRVNARLLPDTGSPAQAVDPAITTRAIAEAAPVPPEKAAATAKAEVEIANARAIAETDAEAKAALEAADEEAKMANRIKNCAMGVAIG